MTISPDRIEAGRALVHRIEDGCRAVYGKHWDGPPEKMPGPEMKAVWRNLVHKAISGAFPELASGSHWLAPREATEEMWEVETRVHDGTTVFPAQQWETLRDAYLNATTPEGT